MRPDIVGWWTGWLWMPDDQDISYTDGPYRVVTDQPDPEFKHTYVGFAAPDRKAAP